MTPLEQTALEASLSGALAILTLLDPKIPCPDRIGFIKQEARNILANVALVLPEASVPEHAPEAPDTLARLKELMPILSAAAIANASGIKVPTLYSKLQRNTPFTEAEASRVREVFNSYGIFI